MLGCDIIEIERIQSNLDRFGERFVNKILSIKELELYNMKVKKVEFIAGRFAAKEAVAKALGKGFITNLYFNNISILSDKVGKPIVYLYEEYRKDIHVSISHSRLNVVAVCVIEEKVL